MSSPERNSPQGGDTMFVKVLSPFPYKSNNKIRTAEFLESSRGVVILVDRLGKVFAPVRYDMHGNIEKIYAKYLQDKEKCLYLEDMVYAENAEGAGIVTDALMWLRRALDFMCRFFKEVMEDVEETQCLTNCMKSAYAESLEPYHGWMGSQLFNIMVRFAPSRTDFFHILAMDKTGDHNTQVLNDMGVFTYNLRKCVHQLKRFYVENNFENTARI